MTEAFAAGTHGKNHLRDGALSQHVGQITMMLAEGSEVTVDRKDLILGR